MRNHKGDLRQYILVSEAWYAETCLAYLRKDKIVDEVQFGFYSPEGGTSGEMSVQWDNLGEKVLSPRLQCYDDAWHALAQFKDVIDAMAEVDGQDISPKEFCQLLERCGFADRTSRTREDR